MQNKIRPNNANNWNLWAFSESFIHRIVQGNSKIVKQLHVLVDSRWCVLCVVWCVVVLVVGGVWWWWVVCGASLCNCACELRSAHSPRIQSREPNVFEPRLWLWPISLTTLC